MNFYMVLELLCMKLLKGINGAKRRFYNYFPSPAQKKAKVHKKKSNQHLKINFLKKKKTFKKKIKQPEKIATLIRLVNITDK